jgi:hypothetical protein
MTYDYNRHRRKRHRSEAELSLAQMLQVVLNEVPVTSGAFFAYTTDSIETTMPNQTPVLTVRPGTFTSTPAGLVIDASTGTITTGTSTPGLYNVTIDIGAAPKAGDPDGTYTQAIQII